MNKNRNIYLSAVKTYYGETISGLLAMKMRERPDERWTYLLDEAIYEIGGSSAVQSRLIIEGGMSNA